jgi:Restriction Enzyme Adenine Methylase Associated/Type I restriction enzyme R protein N terminus (HSDR_N)
MATDARAVLRETLTKVRGRIVELRERGDHPSEQDTKAVLIDPVLAALGWRLDELDEVRREYRAKGQDNPVDYALLVFGQARLFVEAKAFSSALNRKCASQVMGYASTVGVGWCLLTNGDEYRLYNSFANVDVDEKLFRTVRLSDPEQTDLCLETLGLCARERVGEAELDVLWKSQFVDRRIQATLEELFADKSGALARLVRKHSSELSLADVRESLRRAQIQVHFPVVAPPASTKEHLATPPPASTNGHLAPDAELKPAKAPASYAVQLQDLIDTGLVQPPLPLEKMYKGVRLEGLIGADGRVGFAAESYDSLSTAGGMARKSVIGAPPGRLYPQTNGWTFWLYRDAASGELRLVDDLRQQYLQRQA